MRADLPFAALFLDFDGTLVDSEDNWARAEARVMGEYGVAWGPADALEFVGLDLDEIGRRMLALTGATDTDAVGLRTRLVDYAVEDMALHAYTWRPGARDLVDAAAASSVPLGLVTGSYPVVVEPLLREAPHAFDVVVTGDLPARGKPYPDPYWLAADLLGVAASDCVAIEDSRTGTESAFASGCLTITVPYKDAADPRPGLIFRDSLAGLTLDSIGHLFVQERGRG